MRIEHRNAFLAAVAILVFMVGAGSVLNLVQAADVAEADAKFDQAVAKAIRDTTLPCP